MAAYPDVCGAIAAPLAHNEPALVGNSAGLLAMRRLRWERDGRWVELPVGAVPLYPTQS